MGTVLGYGYTVATQVAILFMLIFVGFLIGKLKLIDSVGIDQIINILLFVVNPCVIIIAFLKTPFNIRNLSNLGITAGCAILAHIVCIALSSFFIKVKPKAKQEVLRYGIVFSNAGFMSLPLVSVLVPVNGVFLVSTYIMVFSLFVWTYGISLFSSKEKNPLYKVLLNPGILSVFIGLLLFLFSVKVPSIFYKPIEYLSIINTPIAMIITGYFLFSAKILDSLKDKSLWVASVFRLILAPLIMLAIFRFVFGLHGDLLIAIMIPASAPAAVNTVVMTAKYGDDTISASRLVSLSTLLSIITIPLLLMLTKIKM